MWPYNFFVSRPKFTKFCLFNAGWIAVDNAIYRLSISMHSRDIRCQSRKFSHIAPNFGRFLPSKILRGWCPPNMYHHYHTNLKAHQVAKFHGAIHNTPKVINAHLLKFKPIFLPPPLKIRKWTPIPIGGCASKTWSFSSVFKNLGAQQLLGAEIWSSDKVYLGGHDPISRSP